ncbi:endolytic transglycosylase MltG [Ferruginibacter sp.]|uniref:endolytic transglycosylase MltG n=1 Tax=Ferruginibacter sp. TaxID=1940288 RepID=UPI0026597E9B|nr:endolytic transglycosylase MltG [Ferruginibacter sp.]
MASVKKTSFTIFIVLAAIVTFVAWRIFGSNTDFAESRKSFYIQTGSNFDEVISQLAEQKILKNPGTFKLLAHQLKYDANVKAGRYVIENGASIFKVIKVLKAGRQTPVNLVITKLRTKEDLAQKIGNNFECDSSAVIALLNNNDSLLHYGLDTNTAMTAVIPNTYAILWNTSALKIFKKLFTEQEKFWTTERKKKAATLNLSPKQLYILASIVEEESNKDEDKGKIASVYLNRLQTGMRLSADPTVIFALKDFSIRRVYRKYTEFPSPYNTYLYNGLPPGPVCTPSIKTIDAVLDAPKTNYLYFVAQPNLTGYSNFATTYKEHMMFAKQYQQWLTEYLKAKETIDSLK